MNNRIRNIAFAGAGNVAFHLAKGLWQKGFRISGIWSREQSNAKTLAVACNSTVCTSISDLGKDADLIIIAVTDKAITGVAQMISEFDGLVVHTAGSVNLDVLAGIFKNYGILYPLQTFSKETGINMDEVPFFIEASSKQSHQDIYDVAAKLSGKVFDADSEQRMLLHVAAVFASNYSNLMYTISNELISHSGLPGEVLNTLILETARKATTGDPLKMQTGPARRNDLDTIGKHLQSLALQPEYAELYRLLAEMIIKKYH
jgi:predicted short-subunit dehydrogenase-like oxidoreductase (DUF2520 family)